MGTLGEMNCCIAKMRRWFRRFRQEFTRRLSGDLGTDPRHFSVAAQTLIDQGRRGDADIVLGFGLSLYPSNYRLLREYAWNAQNDRRYRDALARWEAVHNERPNDPVGYCGIVSLLRHLGEFSRASELVAEALGKFPNDGFLISEGAFLAEHRHDWEASSLLWKRVIDRRGTPTEWLQHHGHALYILGKFDELEIFLKTARSRLPQFRGFVALEAMLAASQQRWDDSLAIWRTYRERFPDDSTGVEHYGRTLQEKEFALVENEETRAATTPPVAAAPAKIEIVGNDVIRTLLLHFESIGFDCEFGLVQRRYGAEPLSLLRFNSVAPDNLLAALAERFNDMGDPTTTELVRAGNDEYYLRDRRWGLDMHTFIFVGQQPYDILYNKMCRRVAYLREKFLSDLKDARKILVYSSPMLKLDQLRILHDRLKIFGPVKLLHVRPANLENAEFAKAVPGEVRRIADDLFVGFLSRHGLNEHGSWDIGFDEWIAICRQVKNALETPTSAMSKP